MEQTFADLCREHEGENRQLLSLTVRISVDTGLGIVKERILHFSKAKTMSELQSSSKFRVALGFLLVLPGLSLLGLLLLGIEPPISDYRESPADRPHVFSSVIALFLLIVLPVIGLLINASTARGGLLKRTNLAIAAIGASILVAPLVILQRINRGNSSDEFSTGLFVVIWLLAAIFIGTLLPMIRGVRAGKGGKWNPATLALGAFVLVIAGSLWFGIVNDQMPCFMGVPNCD